MDNFFKQFQDNLENSSEPPFEEKDWLALEKKLPPKNEKHPLSTLLFWGLAPLLLCSLAANWFFYHKMKNTELEMASLNSRFESIHSKTLVFQTDTIYKIHTIIERDTIYKTRVLRETVVSYVTPNLSNNSNLDSNYFNRDSNRDSKDFKDSSNSSNSYRDFNDFSNSNRDFNDSNNFKNFNDNKLIFNTLVKLNSISIAPLKLTKQNKLLELGNFPIIKNEHKTLGQRLEALRPKDYSLGMSAGLLFPFGDGLSHPSGFKWGLNGAMLFSPNVSLWADAHYAQISYNVDKMSDAIGVPVMPPPDRNFIFNKAIIKQPTIQYIAGLRYRFDNQKYWQPYIGLGFGAVTLLPYEVGYEFKNNSLGTVWDVDLKVKQKGTQWGFLLLDAGFEKRLSQHYRWKIGADYRVNITTNSWQKHRILGINSGFMFDF